MTFALHLVRAQCYETHKIPDFKPAFKNQKESYILLKFGILHTNILYLVFDLGIFCIIFYSDVMITQVQILDSDKRIHSLGKDEIY